MIVPPLRERVHSGGEMFSCGYDDCIRVFSTGVAYIYHLNSAHDYTISDEASARRFLVELHKRLDKDIKKSRKHFKPVTKSLRGDKLAGKSGSAGRPKRV